MNGDFRTKHAVSIGGAFMSLLSDITGRFYVCSERHHRSLRLRDCVCIHTHTYVHTYVYTHIDMYLYSHVSLCVCVCVPLYIYSIVERAYGQGHTTWDKAAPLVSKLSTALFDICSLKYTKFRGKFNFFGYASARNEHVISLPQYQCTSPYDVALSCVSTSTFSSSFSAPATTLINSKPISRTRAAAH